MFAPFGNNTGNIIALWHPEPRYRGTYNILSTCLATTVLCVWSAVHLNLPGPNEGSAPFWRYKQLWRKIGWVFFGLFAPEFVAWTAYEQHKLVTDVDRDMRHLMGHTVHSYYSVMGGFTVDENAIPPIVIDSSDRSTRLTLTSAEQIEDKAKANGLAKTIVCVQATWFCFQCLTRVIQGLSISILELNVFAHSLCALLIYVLWWHKPLDVGQPIMIRGEGLKELVALMSISTCCRLASQALRRYGLNNIEIDHALWDDLLTHHVSNFVRSRNRQRWDIDTPDSKDLDTSDLTDGDFETDFFVGFTVSGFLYGGLHLLAWNAPFHSTAEKWLWRSSAISLMSSGLYMGMMAWAISDSERSTTVLVLVLFIFCVAYGAARVYLVVECFTNLAYLPNSAYQMTSWSQYFPHIG
ncbi:hypothetical protein AOQ84DRAFT_320689 [Glonium stellatum]|uniref:Uncharacterized protein n=1 Tax=Glonium stellatum TaxID=574774 RepID=A0A8E2EXV1_9PEZI|nr:hypothetical protein AOQ84DRAFT_320689 [Glonium stellatum]